MTFAKINFAKTTIAALLAAAFPFAALAQSNSPDMFDRNVYQQQRIEQGLRDGSLSVQEAARLQGGEARISGMESRALSDGRVTDAERQRINEAQNRQSAAIARERGDSERGDPNSRSAQRMQADVQRNINEQRRIDQGVESGRITNQEAARLQGGQARSLGQEARAGADGRIDRFEQRGIQRTDNQQSRAISRESHDGQNRGWNQHSGDRGDSNRGGNWNRGRNDHGSYGNHYGQNRPVGANNGNHYGQRDQSNNGNHFGQRNHDSNSTPVTTGSTGTSSNAGTHAGNGNRWGQDNRGSSATTTNTQATTSTQTSTGSRFGQGNRGSSAAPASRGTAVAQAGGTRGGNRR